MGRTILAILFLAALGAAVWFGARWLAGGNDLEATVIFEDAAELAPGSLVVAKSLVIGEVAALTPLEGRDAVTIRVGQAHRDQVLIDSRFSIEGEGPQAVVRVSSTFAFGRPVEQGDVLYARDSRLTRWLEEKGSPILGRIRAEAGRLMSTTEVRSTLDTWSQELPEWKRAGDEVLRNNLDQIGTEVERVERDLRASGRDLDAEKLRREFDAWIDETKRKWADRPATPPPDPAPAPPE